MTLHSLLYIYIYIYIYKYKDLRDNISHTLHDVLKLNKFYTNFTFTILFFILSSLQINKIYLLIITLFIEMKF